MTAQTGFPRSPVRKGMTRKQRRMVLIASAGAVLAISAGLVAYALRDSIVFFYGPTEVVEKGLMPGTRLRLGGLVGLLPDLFREGQGVVTEGVLEAPGRFRADSVLAKHDENYMPREVADALKKQGHWQPGDAKPGADAATTPAPAK
jgi:cytochrome c-type biogenesis protein CcmE